MPKYLGRNDEILRIGNQFAVKPAIKQKNRNQSQCNYAQTDCGFVSKLRV